MLHLLDQKETEPCIRGEDGGGAAGEAEADYEEIGIEVP
jgi:hypothetical protein